MFRALSLILAIAALVRPAHASIFGEENIALMKLVVGQVVELEKLAAALEVAKEQRELLERVNDGVNRALNQIDAIEEIIQRAQRVDPRAIRSLSDLTDMVNEAKDIGYRAKEILGLKLLLVNQSIAQSGIQAETSYTMGQEMIKTGAVLSEESRDASPGRAAQITAAAGSAQMLSNGVLLQTLSHLMQLQALSLDLQKTKMARELAENDAQSQYFNTQLGRGQGRK